MDTNDGIYLEVKSEEVIESFRAFSRRELAAAEQADIRASAATDRLEKTEAERSAKRHRYGARQMDFMAEHVPAGKVFRVTAGAASALAQQILWQSEFDSQRSRDVEMPSMTIPTVGLGGLF